MFNNCPMTIDGIQQGNVAAVAESRLCCSCGACAWACPRNAISYIETVGGYVLPAVDSAACTGCGICTKVCPGISLVPAVADRLAADPFTGAVLETYVGKAADKDLYANSQSGGIVSALLVDALNRQEIGGAVTVVMVSGTPPRACARLARSLAEIREAQKSKYCPVGLLSILSEVERQDRPVAFVGVGCQIQGLHNLCECFPRLKAKVAFTIGLVCDRTMTYAATDCLLKRARIATDDPKVLHFRDKACGGYPGNVNVVCSSGVAVALPSRMRMSMKDFFTPARCRLCFDKMNTLADVTMGDPWGIEDADTVGGESVAVIRTEIGRRIFRRALNEGAVTARETGYRQVLAGQGIERKRVDWRGYAAAWKDLGRPLPNFCEQFGPQAPSRQEGDPYREHLRHAIALDRYSARGRLIAAFERKQFFLRVTGKLARPVRAAKRMLGTGREERCSRRSSMWIELRGVQFGNKGAELMLRAVLQKVSEKFPDASFAMAPFAKGDYVKRAKLGLYQKVWLEKHGVQWGRLGGMIPKRLRQHYGLILDSEIDVVLDASGFLYSDQWGPRHTCAMASYVKRWEKQGTRIVLLPQAMGPFTSSRIREAFASIVEHADLVCPRDDVSYRYVTELTGQRDNVCQAPDFTSLVSGVMPGDPEKFHGRFCLVPNCRMIDKTSDHQSARYISFCAGCIKQLVESGCRPFVLIHEGVRDLELAQQIVRESRAQIEIIEETDALRIKGILGLCSGVISSRFHGLVSALSQGVPALATGWSHKYEMLFKDYGLPDACLSVEIDQETLKRHIQTIIDSDSRKEIVAVISRTAAAQKEQTEKMWRKVFEMIGK